MWENGKNRFAERMSTRINATVDAVAAQLGFATGSESCVPVAGLSDRQHDPSIAENATMPLNQTINQP